MKFEQMLLVAYLRGLHEYDRGEPGFFGQIVLSRFKGQFCGTISTILKRTLSDTSNKHWWPEQLNFQLRHWLRYYFSVPNKWGALIVGGI